MLIRLQSGYSGKLFFRNDLCLDHIAQSPRE
jgi:hypothetical protein